ncbi:disulfide bond formation protein B [uncultured Enterovirga sp.]|uniref:disulfide bond formation protein B n=1 Tax=uncultured Enterovirga sp. TaxID=2026352 RepID=UPI0035CC64AF
MIAPVYRTRPIALAILAIAGATIGGALVSQQVFGLAPCKLCLIQRWPYYAGVPLAALTAYLPPGGPRRVGFALLALVFLVSAGLGAHHAGVEWGFWPGPIDCAGDAGAAPPRVDDFLKQLDGARVVNCADAAFRVLGLSLAGWNALISLALAAIAIRGATIR